MRTNKQALREQVIIDISKHPLIKQAYEVCQAIEKCGASTELTDAVTKASALMQEIANLTGRMDELESAESRIAELEAREVKLPQQQEPTSSGHYGEGYLVPSNAGSALDYEETVEAIRAAGISVKGDSE